MIFTDLRNKIIRKRSLALEQQPTFQALTTPILLTFHQNYSVAKVLTYIILHNANDTRFLDPHVFLLTQYRDIGSHLWESNWLSVPKI